MPDPDPKTGERLTRLWQQLQGAYGRFTVRYTTLLRHISGVLGALAFVCSASCLVLLAVYVGFDHADAHKLMLHRALRAIQIVFLVNIFFDLLLRFRQTVRNTRVLKWMVDVGIILTLLPLLYPHPEHPWLPWLEAVLYSNKFLYIALTAYSVLAVSSVLMRMTGRRTNPSLLLASSFLIFITVSSLLLMMPKCTYTGISFPDSLFVSTSAVCICGLTSVDIASTFTPLGQGILLVMFEIGGLGLITFTSFFAVFFSGKQSVYNQLLIRDFIYSKSMNSLTPTLLYILGFTLVMQVIGAVGIYFTLPDAIADTTADRLWITAFHSVSGFCNVGFSNIPGGMANPVLMRDGASLYVVMSVLVFAGALGFPILTNFKDGFLEHLRRMWHRLHGRRLTRRRVHIYDINTKIVLVTTSVVFLLGFVSFWALENNHALAGMSTVDKAVQSLFNAVMPRSGGFTTINPASFLGVTLMLVVVQMWIGGASQSMAGGIKVNTLGVLCLNLRSIATSAGRVGAFRRSIAPQSIRRANAVTFLSIIAFIVFAVTLMILEPDLPTRSILFETVSATFNVGSSMGITSMLSDASKFVMCVAMFLGRVGLISVLTGMFTLRRDASAYYPEDDVIIN